MSETALSTLKVGDLLKDGVRRLEAAGVSNAAWETREMMAAALGDLPVLVPMRLAEALAPDRRTLWENLLAERCSRKPLAQVLGEWDFAGLRLSVTPDVLVPRPETEELLEWMGKRLPSRLFSLADIGTGSGCLAVASAKRWTEAFIWAVDASPSALAVAKRNAETHGVARRTFFLEGDLMAPLSKGLYLDAVVANLPYVDEKEMGSLSPEVRREPASALNGGKEGLDVIRRLIIQAWERLVPGGKVFLEIGHDQALAVAALFGGMGYRVVETGKDFAGVVRFVMGVK